MFVLQRKSMLKKKGKQDLKEKISQSGQQISPNGCQMGKPWVNGQTVGKWANRGQMGKPWVNGQTLGKWANRG